MSDEKTVKVTVQDHKGETLLTFDANPEESICTQAQEAGAPIPMSCGVGACRTCVAKVVSGKEHLAPEAVGPAMIEVEDDEVLTCICGITEEPRPGAEICIRCENL